MAYLAGHTAKSARAPFEVEVYNVTRDPSEMANLAGDPAWARIVSQSAGLMVRQARLKRLVPQPLVLQSAG